LRVADELISSALNDIYKVKLKLKIRAKKTCSPKLEQALFQTGNFIPAITNPDLSAAETRTMSDSLSGT